MSKRIDLCVEKILARMIVDDEQRGRIEAELRDHLDELVAETRRRGLSEDDAEAEAVRQFGDSTALARAFNLPDGRWWIVFDSLALAGLMGGTVALMPGNSDLRALNFFSIWLIYTVLILYQKLWAKIEINGGIFIRPHLLRRARHIEFSQLKSVRAAKGHLFGKPNVVFEYEGGKVTLPATARGMRAASLAIETLVPNVFEPKLKERLYWLRKRLAVETLTQQLAATLFWFCAIGFYLLGIRLLWKCEGFPWTSAIGLALGFVLAPIQAWRLPNRARAAFLNLTAMALFIALVTTLGATIGGNAALIRQLVVIASMAMGFGLILTWWSGRRITLAVICLAAISAFMLARGPISPDFVKEQSVIGSTEIPPFFFAWTDQGAGGAWIDEISSVTTTLTVVKRGAGFRRYPIYGAVPRFAAPPAGARLQVMTVSPTQEDSWSILYLLKADDRLESMTLPYRINAFNESGATWSPDGRYGYFFAPGKDAKKSESWLLDMQGRKFVQLDQPLGTNVRWLDATKFRSCMIPEWGYSSATTHSLELRETDVHTGTTNVLRTFTLEGGVQPIVLEGMHYALCSDELFDLETGKKITLPSKWGQAFDWDPIRERICYTGEFFANQDSRGHALNKALILFDPREGIVARIGFAQPQLIRAIRLSPDGNHVLIRRSSRADTLGALNAMTQTELWDFQPVRYRQLFTHGVIDGIMLEIFSDPTPSAFSLPCWSPDGSEIVYMGIGLENVVKPRVYSALILARP